MPPSPDTSGGRQDAIVAAFRYAFSARFRAEQPPGVAYYIALARPFEVAGTSLEAMCPPPTWLTDALAAQHFKRRTPRQRLRLVTTRTRGAHERGFIWSGLAPTGPLGRKSNSRSGNE